MATTFEFVVCCEPGQEERTDSLLSDCHAEVTRLENLLSEFRETPLAALNGAPVGDAVSLPPEALELLGLSQRLWVQTAGAFDPTAKSAVTKGGEPGSFQTRVRFDTGAGTAMRLNDGVRVGFGAIGKGYALDRVASRLESEGYRDFFLSAGGSSLLFSGSALPGQPWVFGWSWGKSADGAPLGQRFEVSGTRRVALGISGLQEQSAHLLDPRASQVISNEAHPWRSVCLAHASAAAADALSTGLFVRGFKDFPHSGAMAGIDATGALHWNGAFQALFSRFDPHSPNRR